MASSQNTRAHSAAKEAPKIVAFLQNQWFKDPERIKSIIAKRIALELRGDGDNMTAHEVREEYIAYFLFLGCLTGRRLKAVFGDETRRIVWEEVSREIGGHASSCFPADDAHIREVLDRHKPDIVLAFGKIACDALSRLRPAAATLIRGPHPAARSGAMAGLEAMRVALAEGRTNG